MVLVLPLTGLLANFLQSSSWPALGLRLVPKLVTNEEPGMNETGLD